MKKLFVICFLFLSVNIFAAVGCDLNEPDRDVKRFFPDSANYKTAYESVKKSGGDDLFEKIQHELGEPFSGLYEKIDVSYTIYSIFNKDNRLIGYIHGVNQKGRYGAIQVFLALSPNGIIENVYFQKLTSKQAQYFRSKDFTQNFTGLSLKDFLSYSPADKTLPENGPLAKLKALQDGDDFYSILRGIKKNLILMKYFVFEKGE